MSIFTVNDDFLPSRMKLLSRITSKQEKEALLIEDDEPITEVLKALTDLTPINEKEAEVFLIKIRELSSSDKISYITTCDECQTMNDINIDVSEFIDTTTRYEITVNNKEYILPMGTFTTLESVINSDIVNGLSLREYNEIESVIDRQTINIFNGIANGKCRKCQADIPLSIDPRVNFSEGTLSSLYSDYVNISTWTNNSKLDIDSLYPFERKIYMSLIQENLDKPEK